jgi:hypothetical protein
MFGWIVLALMFWLADAMRTVAGPHPMTRCAASSPDAASLEPVIAARAGLHAAFGEFGDGRKPVWVGLRSMAVRLRRRRLPASAPPPPPCRDEAADWCGRPETGSTRLLNLLDYSLLFYLLFYFLFSPVLDTKSPSSKRSRIIYPDPNRAHFRLTFACGGTRRVTLDWP